MAVKRLNTYDSEIAENELSKLEECDSHPNVIRYFCMETRGEYIYLAIELCHATLAQYVTEVSWKKFIKPITVLEEITKGLDYLHSMRISELNVTGIAYILIYEFIVHRDIKPENILLRKAPDNKTVVVKLSDFGISKQLHDGQSCFSNASNIKGTQGWIAPEILANTNEKKVCVLVSVIKNRIMDIPYKISNN